MRKSGKIQCISELAENIKGLGCKIIIEGNHSIVGSNIRKITLTILTISLTGQIFARTKATEDFGGRNLQTIHQGDASLSFYSKIME